MPASARPTIRFTAAEEHVMWLRMRAGDAEAKELLALSVLDFACRRAFRYSAIAGDDEELVSRAHFAVARALETFDATKGRLTTHVAWWIRSEISQHLCGRWPVHIPSYLQQQKCPRNQQRGWLKHHAQAHKHMRRAVSIEALTEDDTPATHDRAAIAERDHIDHYMDIYRRLMRELAAEDARTATVLRLRLEEGKTLQQVADVLSVTRERVRQIQERGLETLRARAMVA